MKTRLLFLTGFVAALTAIKTSAGVLQDGVNPAVPSARLDGDASVTNRQERVIDMTTDSAGNVYVVGSFSSAKMKLSVFKDRSPVDGTLEEQASVSGTQLVNFTDTGSADIYVAKYDPQGNLLWARSAGGLGDDHATGVVTDPAGNVFITGSFEGQADIGGTTLSATLQTISGAGALTSSGLNVESDLFVSMLSASGQWRWTKRLEYSLLNRPTTFANHLLIDFAPDQPQSGYTLDNGAAFGSKGGFTFGWLTSSGQATDNPNTDDDVEGLDQNFIHTSGMRWRVNLGPGTYQIAAKSGDPDFTDSYYHTIVVPSEGPPKTLIQGAPINNYRSGQVEVTLTSDGYIELREGAQADNNKLSWVTFKKLTTSNQNLPVIGTFGIRSGDDQHVGKAMAIDSDGHLFIKGRFIDTQNISRASGTTAVGIRFLPKVGDDFLLDDDSTFRGAKNAFVTRLKLDNIGADKTDPTKWQWDWLTPFGTGYYGTSDATADNVSIADLAVDSLGNVIAGGFWRGTLTAGGSDFESTNNTPTTANTEGFVMRLRRSDGGRSMLATVTADTSTDVNRSMTIEALSINAQDQVTVLGNFNPRLNDAAVAEPWIFKDSGSGALAAVTPGSVRDFFVARLDSNGAWLGAPLRPGGTGRRVALSLAADPAGALYVTGSLQGGTTSFGATSFNVSNPASAEPFVAKLTASADAWVNAIKEDANNSSTIFAAGTAFGIDCAGIASFTASDGVVYQADNGFTPSPGSTSTYSVAIANTTDDQLYLRERFGTNFSYNITVPNGEYRVTLKFAENFTGNNVAGRRKFDVVLQNQKVLDDFDIFTAAGGLNRAVDRTFDTVVSSSTLTIQFQGNQAGSTDINAKIDAIRVEKLQSGQKHHGVQLAASPTGTMWWLVSSGRDSSLDSDLLGGGLLEEYGVNYQLGSRTGPNASFDTTGLYGGFLLAADLTLTGLPLNNSGFFVGQEITPPAGVYRDGSNKPLQPDIYQNGTLFQNAANFFQWDTTAAKMYALAPVADTELRWRVNSNIGDSARIIQSAEIRLPNDADRLPGETGLAYQTHIGGGGLLENEPSVELDAPVSSYQFVRHLPISGTSSVSGKTFSATAQRLGDVWSTLVYQRKTGASALLQNTLVIPVRTRHFRDVTGAQINVDIGKEIVGANYSHSDPSGKNGYVLLERARYDGEGTDAAHHRAERTGPIIPVNTDEPPENDDLAIAWYGVNAKTNAVWPDHANLFKAQWPVETTTTTSGITRTTPEKIFIVSQLGSEMELFGSSSLTPVLAINSGGAPFTASDGTVFAADNSVSGANGVFNSTHGIAGTTDDQLYQDGIYSQSFAYALATGNGSFVLTLYFADRQQPGPLNSGGMDITVEGVIVRRSLVVANEVGASYTAYSIEVPVTVTDGVLNVRFDKAEGFQEAYLSALKVTTAAVYAQERLDPAKFLATRIYHQPDKTKPGYNPNEEHALLAPSQGSGFNSVFALRNDLNHRGTTTSDPYVLLKYQDAQDGGRWKMKVYSVAVTGSISVGSKTHTFDFTNFKGTAGKRVQPPYPLSLFPDQAQTAFETPPVGTRNAYWQDRKGSIWARSDGQVIAKYWYPLQPSFWLDTDGNGTQDTATNTPWLEFYTGTNSTPQSGDAVKIIYDIAWPAYTPVLFAGETLREAKRGLPDVFHWASGGIVFDQNEPAVSQLRPGEPGSSAMLRLTARLIDSMSERAVSFDAKVAGTGLTTLAGADMNLKVAIAESGRYEFTDMEPHLRGRMRFDPITRKLIFRGLFDKSQPAAPLELLNVVSTRERTELKALDQRTNSAWDTAIDALYALTRNPNGVNPALISGENAADIYVGIQHRVDANGVKRNDIVPENVLAGMALTAGFAEGAGYITLTENNDPALGPLPVALHVVKVEAPSVVGSVRVINSLNPLDEKITLRHSADFGGNPDDLYFEWYVKQDSGGRPPASDFPPPGGGNGWIVLPESGLGVNSVVIAGSGLRTLADQWVYVRYRMGTPSELSSAGLPSRSTLFPATFSSGGSDLAGDPAFVSENSPMFAPGWIKRVLEGIDPFEQRVKDFHSAPTTSYVSMIQQAGGPFQGAVALNGDPDNINNTGLISLYETVIHRGFDLSINGIPSQSNGAVNNALLLAASRISDLYMLLGNEAFADAQDPTIGFNVDGGNETNTIDSSTFAFQNALPSLIQEELSLLRGRDNTLAGTQASPVFNRLYWNFSNGLEGEPAYVLNYEISDAVGGPNGGPDGFIRSDDAAYVYPMGHGDAWGHYLSSIKSYYRLLRHPAFTWTPRSESTIVAGVTLNVDYLDEVKFARAASARARAAESIVELTHRDSYVADPAGQWQGYKDTDPARAWGVDEWARRAGQGAIFDWAVATAILPQTSPHGTSSLDKIDRETVGDLREITSSLTKIQGELDKSDKGLNPLGLHNDVIPFDIDPNFTETEADILGQTHFEQIYGRAISAVDNARRTFDQASQLTEQLRSLEVSSDEYRQEIAEQEFDFKNRLIEIFGYPYSGDIGPGKAYPTGYDGPDLYKWMYVPVADLTGDTLPPVDKQTSVFYKAFSFESELHGGGSFEDVLGHFFPGDVPSGGLLANNSALPNAVPFTLSAGRWAFTARPDQGERRAPGRLQMALNQMLQAQAGVENSRANYDSLAKEILDERDLLQARFHLQDHDIQIKTARNAAITSLDLTIGTLKVTKEAVDSTAEIADAMGDDFKESLPKIAGLAFDPSAGARGVIKSGARATYIGLKALSLVGSGLIESTEFAKSQTEMWTDLEIEKDQYKFEAQEHLKSLEQLLRNEINARLEIFTAERELEAASGDFQSTLAEGQRVMEERLIFRRKMAGPVQELRYEDITFRNFRNESLQRYKASFDLAARYAFLAAKAYDYETCLLGSDTKAGQQFLADIIKQRSLGQFVNDLPVHGVNGLSDPLARMRRSFAVLKSQLGFNNPQTETGQFSLRHELFRMRDSTDAEWQQTLADHRVKDLWQVPEFKKFCRPFAPETAGAQPGIVIPFGTNITYGLNFFGWPLAGGDSAYDSSRFTTKARSVGVWFENYSTLNLSTTPRVYLIPVGTDIMRTPTGDSFATREFQIVDQALPDPFPIGASDLNSPDYIPFNDSLDNGFLDIRRFSRFRAYHDAGITRNPNIAEMPRDTRLVGRSVWNTRWLLIIPGGTFLNDPNEGLETFIFGKKITGSPTQRDGNGNQDIKFFFETYSYSGL